MQRRLLIIVKEPEFDIRGDVVLGQCEPFTSGWSLVLIDTDGKRESLMVGTYTDLRKVQESCNSIDAPAAVRKRVNDMRTLMMSSVTETVALHFDRRPPIDAGETQELKSIRMSKVPKQTPGGLLSLQPNGDVIIATVAQPERADDAKYLKEELSVVVECHPKGVVIDLGRVSNLSAGSFKELAGVRDQLRDNGAELALCNVTLTMLQKIQSMKARETLTVFEDQTRALDAMKL
ncbi:MAG TPA: STAS domain-containing protein [Planctomycetota bacterium]|nr:STAS domain-containing protein [Planctomycetota bacterium]